MKYDSFSVDAVRLNVKMSIQRSHSTGYTIEYSVVGDWLLTYPNGTQEVHV